MTQTAHSPHPMTRTALRFAPSGGILAVAAIAAVLAGVALPQTLSGMMLFGVGGTFAALAGAIRWMSNRLTREHDGKLDDKLAAFVAHDAAPSFISDTDGGVMYQNRSAVERFGSRSGQTLTRTLSEIFANPASVLDRMQTKAASRGAAREDMVTRRGHVRLAVHRIGPERFLWRLEDMAERATGGRGAETISLPMLTASKTGTILFMNEALRRLVGQRVKSIDRIFIELPVRPGAEQQISTAGGNLSVLVTEVSGPGGRREMYFLPGLGLAALSSEAAAQAQSARIFDTLPVALLRLTSRGHVQDANRAARQLVGDIPAAASLSDLVEGLGRSVNDWLADAAAGRADGRPEVLRARHGESEAFLQVTLTRTGEGPDPTLIAVLSDATQLKTLEAQFVQSQKMQAIGQLAGGVAHDFNNLLTAISGHCDLLLLRHDKGDPEYADLVQINQNANRAASLVGQLLAFSRKQTLTPKVIDLRDTLSDLTHLLNRLVGEKVNLGLTHDPMLRPIRADKRQLEQVVMNLVVNARDAMPQGGAIRIATANVTLAEELHRDRATLGPGDYVVVRVTDEGTGIAPDRLPKIFEPFYTTKRTGEGTGLGLSTAYGIVKQSGGFIFCDTVLGAGTTFTLYFPAHDHVDVAQAEVEAVTVPKRPMRTGAGVVLLVEDEAPVRAFASRALRLRGYTVIEAQNAEEALHMLDDGALAVDVFVTDVIMPGMDGPSWVREALKARPGTRVVFVSGYAEDSFANGRSEIPNSVFLPKPFSLSELTTTVQNQFH